MAIARIVVTRVEGKVFEDAKAEGGLSVATNSTVDSVEIEEIGKQKIVVAKWGLETEYKPKIGKIEVEGKIYLTGDADKITKKEGGKLILAPEQGKEVHQAVLRMPLIVCINLARELGLPLPINFPTVELSEKDRKGAA
jgi:hypothetical protein